MSGVALEIDSASVQTGSGSAKTILMIKAGSNHRVLIDEWGIDFRGVSNSAQPIQVELVIDQTTDGTPSSAVTPKKQNDGDDETLQVTAGKDYGGGSEPAGGTVLETKFIHPQQGYTWPAPFGREIPLRGGARLGIRVNAGADVPCTAHFKGTE